MAVTERIACLSIATNLLLVAIKAGLAVLSGSLAIKADAIHSPTDVASSVIILLGIKIAQRPARGFPYGLYKVENLVALGTSGLIFYVGYEICAEVLAGPRMLPTQIPWAALGIGSTIVITWWFSRYELKKGRETGSPSLVADARHVWSDMLSSLVILVSLLGAATGVYLDHYAALDVVVFIGRTAIGIFLDAVRVLLDASLDNTSLTRIRTLVLADPRVVEINELRARNAGRYKFVELDITLRVSDLERGHRISEELENRLKREIAQVDRILIHYQPRQKAQLTYAIPIAADRKTVSEHFGAAPFFRLVTLQTVSGMVISERILENPYLEEEKSKGIKVAEWLLENGLDVLISHQDQAGKGPQFVLGNSGAEILITKEREADNVLSMVQAKAKKYAGRNAEQMESTS
jgi:cation diffusion facilitator family transporter